LSYPCEKTDDYDKIMYRLDEKPFGKTWNEWTIEWWKWLLSIQEPDNPANDDSGRNSGQKQSGPVWFLAGTKEQTDVRVADKPRRKCIIPADKAIFFPIVCDEVSFAEKPNVKNDSDLIALARCDTDGMIKLELMIDADFLYPLKLEPLYTGHLCKYRISSPVFDLTLPENNLFHGEPGPTRAASDGYWIFLKPLSQGKNRELTIHFRGIEDDYRTQATYNIVLE
jgi:hypothetical protein